MKGKGSRLAACAVVAAATGAATAAAAQISLSISPSSGAPAIGRVADATTDTVFLVNASTGAVSRVSGNAVRLVSTATTSPTIRITCGAATSCNTSDVRVRVTAGAAVGGRASIASFSVANLTDTTYNSGAAPAEAAALDFQLNPIGANDSDTFKLGLRIRAPTTGATGTSTLPFTVTVTLLP